MLSLPIVLCDLGPTITLFGLVACRIRPVEKAHGEPDALSVPAIRHTGAGYEALDSRHLRGGMAYESGARHGVLARARITTRREEPGFGPAHGGEAVRPLGDRCTVVPTASGAGSTPAASKGRPTAQVCRKTGRLADTST